MCERCQRCERCERCESRYSAPQLKCGCALKNKYDLMIFSNATKELQQLEHCVLSDDVPTWAMALLVMNSMLVSFCIFLFIVLHTFTPIATTWKSSERLLSRVDATPERRSVKVSLAPKPKSLKVGSAATRPREESDDLDDMEI